MHNYVFLSKKADTFHAEVLLEFAFLFHSVFGKVMLTADCAIECHLKQKSAPPPKKTQQQEK